MYYKNLWHVAVTDKISEEKNKTEEELYLIAISTQFKELIGLLQDNNLRAKTLAQAMSPVFKTSAYKNPWDDLLKALSQLDFEVALQILLTLAKQLKISL